MKCDARGMAIREWQVSMARSSVVPLRPQARMKIGEGSICPRIEKESARSYRQDTAAVPMNGRTVAPSTKRIRLRIEFRPAGQMRSSPLAASDGRVDPIT